MFFMSLVYTLILAMCIFVCVHMYMYTHINIHAYIHNGTDILFVCVCTYRRKVKNEGRRIMAV